MEYPHENILYQAILREDHDAILQALSRGANPNMTLLGQGTTCLGEAACAGNVDILKVLISASQTSTLIATPNNTSTRKRQVKCHKRKLKQQEKCEETIVKCKNLSDRTLKDCNFGQHNAVQIGNNVKTDKNQGYFVLIHSEGSSSDESKRCSLVSPLLTPSPQDELEWDEEIGNVAPTTREDEEWSSTYKWYATILESTGAAIASASIVSNGIDQQDSFMKTALHYASYKNHPAVAKLLIEAGCKVDITEADGLTPLHIAVYKNHTEIVQLLVKAGSNVNYKTCERVTPLHFAASAGFLDVVKILVNNGANLEARDTAERTPLYLATYHGHVDVVKYLVGKGANVNGEEIHGYTPLCEAVWQMCAVILETLLTAGARITHSHRLLHKAIKQRQDEMVEMLTDFGGGINLYNENGDTPLLLAVRMSLPNIIRILLNKGANPNSCNSITGDNALHIAVESVDDPNDFEELLKCLLDHHIDMNAPGLTGDTALNRALLLSKKHATVLLIRYGADVNYCDIDICALDNVMRTSRSLSFTLASMLLKAGHSIRLPDTIPLPGTTAYWLYDACKNPFTLKDICRIKIRDISKNTVLYRYILSLPLPKCLKEYLMLEDEGWE